ncbi:MAG: zinc-binding dehydrogenase [Chloroflexi bacterium]|nr:zinc-binding dehydrogenase [Chloroflexota bacterium]
MFAAKLVAPQTFELIEMPPPDIETAPPGSIIVRTRRATTCGSDMPYYLGTYPSARHMAPEAFPAHECVGEVVATTSDKFHIGDTVMAQPDQFTGLGQFYLARERHATLIPNDGDWNRWVMCQPLGTVIWGFRHISTMFHQTVVVLGQGGIGLFCTQLAACLGARNIIVVDPIEHRRSVALSLGATHALGMTDDLDLAYAVEQIVGKNSVDTVIEAVGHQTATVNTSIKLIKYGGTVLAFGVPDQAVYPIHYSEMFRKNVQFVTTVTSPDYPKEFELAVEYIKRGLVNVRPFITHEFPFSQVAEAYELFASRRDNVIKVLLNYDQQS